MMDGHPFRQDTLIANRNLVSGSTYPTIYPTERHAGRNGADRPIIFSGPMVRALLAGRKTQTRRILKVQPPTPEQFRGSSFGLDRAVADGVKLYSQNDYDRLPKHPTDWELLGSVGVARDAGFPKRYRVRFALGDRLWVREAWAPLSALTHNDPGPTALINRGFYRADEGTVEGEITRWRPSIHMPRWASRLTLVVTEVRVERLQDISEADAAAEGGTPLHAGWWSHADGQAGVTAKASFGVLWNSINGPDAWAANPWVAAISFDVAQTNIDALPLPSPALTTEGA